MVTAMALDYRLMSQYTSFVAVDAQEAQEQTEPPQPPRRMLVPVPLPEGTRWEGFFGDEPRELAEAERLPQLNLGKQVQRLAEAKKIESLGRLAPSARPQRDKLSLNRARGLSRRAMPATILGLAVNSPQPAAPAARPMAGDRFYFQSRGGAAGRLGGIGGGFGGGGFGGAAEAFRIPVLNDELSREESDSRHMAQALAAHGAAALKAAQESQQSVQALQEQRPEDTGALRQALLRAYFLDMVAVNAGHSDGSIAGEALEQLETLHEKQLQQWTKELPQLNQKLDLVLRDRSIAEALAAVGQAAGVKITLTDGSVQDASSLLQETPRVTWLDLRRATVAQALDWILLPARMSWSPAEGGIAAGTDRRRAGLSPWVYHVADIALPAAEELEKLGDEQKAAAEAQQAAEEFVAAVRKELKAEEPSVMWYGAGQLLVFGEPAGHAKVAELFAALRTDAAKPQAGIAELHAKTVKRHVARKEQLAKASQARLRLAAAAVHDQFGWQLLAGVAGGWLDDEALTELSIAWRSEATAQLLKGDAATLVLRSLWILREAARSLPQERELTALAQAALEQSAGARARLQKALDAKPGDESTRLGVLYASLAHPGDAAYTTRALAQLTTEGHDASIVPPTLARALLGEPMTADRQALIDLLGHDLQGADRVALTALACRRAGGEAWETFRAQARDVLGGQELPGEVVVLVNRLSQPLLSLAQEP
jgi:hypothetical protein